jgi:hypothetical protein
MATTITTPIVGAPFGPGFEIQLSSTFVGPISGPFWEVDILTTDTEHTLYASAIPTNSPGFVTDTFYVAFVGTPVPNKFVLHGSDVTLRVQLTGSAGVVETTTRTVKLDEIQGRIMEVSNKVAQIGAQISGLSASTFGSADRATLNGIQTSLSTPMGITGDVGNIPLASLISKPPVGFLKVGPVVATVTGDGFLDGDHGLLPSLFGLWWEFSAVPEGYGSTLGSVIEYELRMLQLRTIYSLDGVEFVHDYQDFNVERVLWFWQEAKPSRVEYSISPGVEVQFHYIEWISL